ncbi:MAG TPA: hypothetical protein ENJ19_08095 [Gammaproteobacteria bacterium]|nr:hypothetical protein [Gammaproteobacteria bacterium]
MNQNKTLYEFTAACYLSDRQAGALVVITSSAGNTQVKRLPVAKASGAEAGLKPVFIGLSEDDRVVLLDPQSKSILLAQALPADAFPAHLYTDPSASRGWFMNDGDKASGNDVLNCGDLGSSVTVVENVDSSAARFLKTICVGRGHHQCHFSWPSEQAPEVPRRAWVSNLKDGTVSVVGNDPADGDSYLQVVATINLCEADKEEGVADKLPNQAFPHGLAYSPWTGKVYNLNNGYGTVAVIDPLTHAIEQRVPFKGHSNLFATPDGRYLIGRGADRKSDPRHVIARLSVMDATTLEITDQIELPDIYLSKYFFSPDSAKLYFTAGASGSTEQQANLKTDAVLVFDLGALPKLVQSRELRLGAPSGTLDFVIEQGVPRLVLASTAAAGTVSVIDAERDELVDTLSLGESRPHSRLWVLRR